MCHHVTTRGATVVRLCLLMIVPANTTLAGASLRRLGRTGKEEVDDGGYHDGTLLSTPTTRGDASDDAEVKTSIRRWTCPRPVWKFTAAASRLISLHCLALTTFITPFPGLSSSEQYPWSSPSSSASLLPPSPLPRVLPHPLPAWLSTPGSSTP